MTTNPAAEARAHAGPEWCRNCAVQLGGPHRSHEYRIPAMDAAMIAAQLLQLVGQTPRVQLAVFTPYGPHRGSPTTVALTPAQATQLRDLLTDLLTLLAPDGDR